MIVTPILGLCKCSMFVVRYFVSILVLQSLQPLWDSVIVLRFVVRYFVPILFLKSY